MRRVRALTRARACFCVLAGVMTIAFGAAGLTLSAAAQDGGVSPGYGPETLTFETWCGEIRGYDAKRCARRDSADVAAFQGSLQRLQEFESEDQKQVRRNREFREQFDSHDNTEPSRTPRP